MWGLSCSLSNHASSDTHILYHCNWWHTRGKLMVSFYFLSWCRNYLQNVVKWDSVPWNRKKWKLLTRCLSESLLTYFLDTFSTDIQTCRQIQPTIQRLPCPIWRLRPLTVSQTLTETTSGKETLFTPHDLNQSFKGFEHMVTHQTTFFGSDTSESSQELHQHVVQLDLTKKNKKNYSWTLRKIWDSLPSVTNPRIPPLQLVTSDRSSSGHRVESVY